jgi:hypothetical protein
MLAAASSASPVGARGPSESGGGSTGNNDSSEKRGNMFCVSCIVDSQVCGGSIGAGGTFCARPAGVCETKSHKQTRHEFGKTDAFYVMKTGDIAFSSPSVSISMVTESLRNDWASVALTANDWGNIFMIAASGSAPATDASLELGLDAKTKARLFETPAKVRSEVGMSYDDLKMAFDAEFSPFKVMSESAKLNYNESDGISLEALQAQIQNVERGLVETGVRVELVTDYLSYQVKQSNKAVDTVFLQLKTTGETIGMAPRGLPTRFIAPDLWGTVATIVDTIMKPDSDKLSRATVDAIKIAEQGLKAATNLLQNNSLSLFKILMDRLNKAEVSVASLEATGAGVPGTPPSGGGGLAGGFGSLFGNPTPHEATSGATTLLIDDLRKRLSKLEVASETGEVTFTQQLGLLSLEDTDAWTTLNCPSRRFGLFMDVFLLLDRMKGDSDSVQQSMLTTMDKQVRLKIQTGSEALALGALRQSVPALFHSTTMGANETYGSTKLQSFLSRLNSHKEWSNGGHGMKAWMIGRIATVRNSILQDINQTLVHGTIAYQVAVDCLSRSVAWVNLLMTFIDSNYESLHVHSKFSKEQAWSLLTQLVTRVFTDMSKVREGVLMSLRMSDENGTCAAVLWAVFQTHDHMDAYFNANITDHPSISSEYVKFLASNSGIELVDKLESQVNKLAAGLSKAQDETLAIRKKADTASNLVDVLQRKVTALEAKVKNGKG